MKRTEPDGQKTEYEYTLRNLPSQQKLIGTGGQPLVTEYQYDKVGRLEWSKAPTGRKDYQEYDELGRVTRQGNDEAGWTRRVYDDNGNVTAVTDGRGYTTLTAYNVDNIPYEVTDPQLGRQTTVLDPWGRAVKTTDPEQNTRTYRYDELSRLLEETTPWGTSLTSRYDAWNNPVTSTASGKVTTRIYRDDNRLVSETITGNNEALTTTFSYDEGGEVKSVTQGGVTTTYNTAGGVYRPDPYGLVRSKAQVVAGNNLVTGYSYDNRQRLTQATAPDGTASSYGYNQLGQLTTLSQWINGTLGYDDQGRLRSYKLANNLDRSFDYDSQDRVKDTEYSLGSDVLKAYNLTYDQAGNIATKNQNTYTYDQLNRLVGASEKGWFTVKPENLNPSYGTVDRDFDGQTEISFNLTSSTNVTLDNATRSVGVDLGAVYGVSHIELVPTYSNHRVRGRDLKFSSKKNPGDAYQPLTGWTLETRADGSLFIKLPQAVEARYVKITTSWDDRNAQNLTVENLATFANLVSQLVKVGALASSKTEGYEYDGIGNRTRLTQDTDSKTSRYYANAQGGNLTWLAYSGLWYYQYDDQGNLITKAQQAAVNYSTRDFVLDTSKEYWTYTWDLKNRLSSVSKNGTLVASYTYDSDNLRVTKTKGTETQIFAYGRTGALVYQKNLATGKARTYAYLGDQTVGWTDTAANGTKTKYWAVTDHLGSVTAVADTTGKSVWSSEYDPFGKTAGAQGQYEFDGSYAGHEVDPDTGLIYMWNRWQDPETGRFVSEDPARDGGNWYSYVHSNPLRFTDPTGLMTGEDYYKHYMATTPNSADPTGTNLGGSGGKPAGPPLPAPEAPKFDFGKMIGDMFNKGGGVLRSNEEVKSALSFLKMWVIYDAIQGGEYNSGRLETLGQAFDAGVAAVDLSLTAGLVAADVASNAVLVGGLLKAAGKTGIESLVKAQKEGAFDAFGELLAKNGKLVGGKNAYDGALAGGRHAGFLKQYLGKTNAQLEKGVTSLEKQIAEHRGKIANPESAIPNFRSLDTRQQQALLTQKWPSDIARQQEQLEILSGILRSR